MITIQGFAKLCGCNTQTLRYYDRIGLLKPARVDEWTGYRYYEEEQALQFVKIKNLQQADFSIEEIKALLPGDDDLLAAAFEQKIEEQQQKLERIREIQRSYLKETMDMQKLVSTIIGFMEEQLNSPTLWEEFGIDMGRKAEITAKANAMLADMLAK
ncbi:MAG: MerR family transcriptional regulator, partial [Opitutales bacterium]|nr:MerR family transcriptional regulator [Opitutales bacterium]